MRPGYVSALCTLAWLAVPSIVRAGHGAEILMVCVGPGSFTPSARPGDIVTCSVRVASVDTFNDTIQVDRITLIFEHALGDTRPHPSCSAPGETFILPPGEQGTCSYQDRVRFGDDTRSGDGTLHVRALATGIDLLNHGLPLPSADPPGAVPAGLPITLEASTRVQIVAGCGPDQACDDRFACNGQESCVDGVCHAGTQVTCSDPCSRCISDAGCQPFLPCCGNGTNDDAEQCDLGRALNGTDAACCTATCTFRPGLVCRPSPSTCVEQALCTSESEVCPDNAFSPPDTGCTDGDVCTLEDTCVEGTCRSGPRVCDAIVSTIGKATPGTGTPAAPPRKLLVQCTGQPRSQQSAFCRVQAFVTVTRQATEAGSPSKTVVRRSRAVARGTNKRCRPGADGKIAVTASHRRPVTAGTSRVNLKLNGCFKALYKRVKPGDSVPVDVDVTLTGVQSDAPAGSDTLLHRTVTIVRRH